MAEARYDAVADTYGLEEDDPSAPATSALRELAGPVGGRRLLDVACGHGPIAREMARHGAMVTGVDISNGLLARARAAERDDPLGITYIEADITDTATTSGMQFDVVVCNFGMSDIDDLDGACTTVSRVLVPGRPFVFSILHPCFSGVADVSGSWPTHGRYYDEGWWLADGRRSTLRNRVGSNHRQVSTYVNALLRHGLELDRLEEPAPAALWASTRPGVERLPVFLVVRCLKGGAHA